jgi:hypothetical protein
VLLPARIDDVAPPLGFTLIQAADLIGWRGDRADPRWSFFLQAIQAILRGARPASFDAPVRRARSRGPVRAAAMAVGAAVILFGAVAVGTYLRVPPTEPPAVSTTPTAAPSVPTPAPPAPAALPQPVPAAPVPPQPSAGEQALWDRAVEGKTRQGFQSYLLSYPNGAYAQRARDVLLTCRTETRESWKPGPDVANQMLRGVADTAKGMTPIQACTKAKADVHSQAKLYCETITVNGGYRNAKWTVTDRDCDCQKPNDRITVCIADLPYSCRWEMKVPETVDVCG